MTLGTVFPPSRTQTSESVHFYTEPANASVRLGDTYYTFLIVKHSSSVHGYCYVELGIGKTSIKIHNATSSDYNHEQWNISMASIHNPDHGLCIAQLNITFDNTTLKGISANLTDANRTSISIRYRFRIYGTVDPSSTVAFIDIKESNSSDNDDSEESGSGVDDNGTHIDSREGGNVTTGNTQESISSHMTSNSVDKNSVSSSFQLGIVTEILIICSLIVLSFSVV